MGGLHQAGVVLKAAEAPPEAPQHLCRAARLSAVTAGAGIMKGD